jgi:CBS domain containing-hemolysin-like protein
MAFVLLALATAIFLSAFLTAAELAVFAHSESRIRGLAEDGVKGSGALACFTLSHITFAMAKSRCG